MNTISVQPLWAGSNNAVCLAGEIDVISGAPDTTATTTYTLQDLNGVVISGLANQPMPWQASEGRYRGTIQSTAAVVRGTSYDVIIVSTSVSGSVRTYPQRVLCQANL
jgi:hypothetical protein